MKILTLIRADIWRLNTGPFFIRGLTKAAFIAVWDGYGQLGGMGRYSAVELSQQIGHQDLRWCQIILQIPEIPMGYYSRCVMHDMIRQFGKL